MCYVLTLVCTFSFIIMLLDFALRSLISCLNHFEFILKTLFQQQKQKNKSFKKYLQNPRVPDIYQILDSLHRKSNYNFFFFDFGKFLQFECLSVDKDMSVTKRKEKPLPGPCPRTGSLERSHWGQSW